MPYLRMDDRLEIPTSRRIQDTGAMIAKCAIARTGVLQYKAKELGDMFKDRDPESLVKVMQLEDNLFSDETLDKFRSAPVTIGHPTEDVTTENMKELSKGMLEGRPTPDGNKLESSIVLSDKEAIDLVEGGTTELSACAFYKIVRVDDQDYDAVREVSRVNHVAIVERGRAGRECKIYDADPFEEVKPEDEVQKLADKIADFENKVKDLESQVSTLEAERDNLNEKLEAAKEVKVSDEDVEQMVKERVEFISNAAKLSDEDVTGMSVPEGKRKIVSKLLDKDLSDKDDSYINARFDILLEDSEGESPMAKVIKESMLADQDSSKEKKKEPKDRAKEARDRMIKRYENKGA